MSGAVGIAEEVCVPDPVLLDSGAQGPHDVVLAPLLAEALGAVAAVERLVRISHRGPTLPLHGNLRSGVGAGAKKRRRRRRETQSATARRAGPGSPASAGDPRAQRPRPAPGCDGQALGGTTPAPQSATRTRGV